MFYLVAKRILGIILVIIGLIALVTPLTPGAWLGLVGLELLGATFLLPKPIRTRWVIFKEKLIKRFWK